MTLRTRIAAVASVSVALAVLVAALGVYVAVRSDLRGEVDSTLRARARALVRPPGPNDGDDGPGGYGGPGGGGGSYGAAGFPGRVEPAPFGAASGYVEFISPAGQVFVPGGQGSSSRKIALTASDRTIAAQ